MIAKYIVSSKTEGPNNLITVSFRPVNADLSPLGYPHVVMCLSPDEARDFEPSTVVDISVAVQ